MATATGHGGPPHGVPTTADGVEPRGSESWMAGGVDPTAPAGELLAVIGPAGSVRTSLLLALGGRLRPRGGTAEVGGARPPDASREVRRRVAVARADGAAAPDPYDRVGDLLELAGHRTGTRAVDRALGRAGLAVVDRPEADMPGALTRRARYEELHPADRLLLAVALALIGEPETLLVDAVDDGQDDTGSHRVWTRLRNVADSGTTVIATSGSADTAGRYAHRTVLLPHAADDEGVHGAPPAAGRSGEPR